MKNFICASLLLLISISSQACRPAYMEFSPVFDRGASQLSADEIRRLLDWRQKTRTAFPNGGDYVVEVQASKIVGAPEVLAKQRLQYLMRLLKNVGVPQNDVFEAAVRQRDIGKVAVNDKQAMEKASLYINTAFIVINPRCPHACCPGPEPISKP